MAATDAGRLLSTLCSSDCFVGQWWTTFISLFSLEFRTYFSFLKLVIKPDSLLLEDRRSQASSERHNQTSAFQMLFELVFVDQLQDDEKIDINDIFRMFSSHCLKLKLCVLVVLKYQYEISNKQ